jgi:hypothetical protein
LDDIFDKTGKVSCYNFSQEKKRDRVNSEKCKQLNINFQAKTK